MFFSLCVCVCVYVLAGKGKVKAGKGRPLKGGGDPAEEPTADVVSVASGRGMGGSAPATPTEAESATNQSATGSWSRNSLRGSKCNFPTFFLLVVSRTKTKKKRKEIIFHFYFSWCPVGFFFGGRTSSVLSHLALNLEGRKVRGVQFLCWSVQVATKNEWMWRLIF